VLRVVIETSGASALRGAALRRVPGLKGKRVGASLSGGDIEPQRFAKLIGEAEGVTPYVLVLAAGDATRELPLQSDEMPRRQPRPRRRQRAASASAVTAVTRSRAAASRAAIAR